MAGAYDRDLIGYGANPPDPKWPGGARLAVNFVINYEEGSEPSVQDGEGFTEIGLTEAHGRGQQVKGRDLAGESMFEYCSRVGFWRLLRLFQARNLPLTIFGCALAIERHPPAAAAIRASQGDACCPDPEAIGAGLYSALQRAELPDAAVLASELSAISSQT